jgi:putative N6-adenine-specific DNA methylase
LAGVLLLSGWDGQGDFRSNVWSGTFLAAAMIACNIPANINRKEFALKNGTTGTMSCLIYIPLVY